MNSSKAAKKRRKEGSRNKNGGDEQRPSSEQPPAPHFYPNNGLQQKQKQQLDKQKRHQEALALSQQLRQLLSQKRLKECINLYHSPTYDELRDAHHGSIVVDGCARCGDVEEAEKVVNEMLQSRKSQKKEKTCQYFWEGYKLFSYKQVPIQAWTALLKGYVHSGMMAKADSLFNYLCATHRSIAVAGDEGNKQRKRKREGTAIGPNVRTLNTLLRGCLWTATSVNNDCINSITNKKARSKGEIRNEMVGGVMTAQRAWSLCEANFSCDSSSYEYFISILSQSLQCKRAEDYLQKMRSEFGIPHRIHEGKSKIYSLDSISPSLIESVVVCLVVIARGYSLLGKMNDALRCSEEALNHLDEAGSAKKESAGPSSNDDAPSTKKQTTGGKKAWKDGRGDVNVGDDKNSYGQREESNKLFRNHRQSELRSEALSLQNLCSQYSSPSPKQGKQAHSITTTNASRIAQFMLMRLFYFNGGGTTGKDATQITTDSSKENAEEDIQQCIHSLWYSFGLKETVQRMFDEKDEGSTLKSILLPLVSSETPSKKNKHHFLPPKLSPEVCERLSVYIVGEDNAISNDGRINFKKLFSSLNDDTDATQKGKKKSLHIELGAGSGDWAALQAELNPSDDYVTVELRADRVAQTFAKCLLHQNADKQSKHAPLTNLCCVGSECGSFLRDRVQSGSVNTIYVNHPEPPTQTYNPNTNKANEIGGEEPAHMLNSQIILSAAHCLEPNGKGRLIIVTDNLIYARLICRTMAHVLEEDGKLVGLSSGEVRDLKRIESFGHSSIHLYEGKPSLSIGHYTPTQFEGGTSYFDRLWRTGAGKHASMRKRFIIALQTRGGNSSYGSRGINTSYAATQSGGYKQSPKPNGEEKKSNKKRGSEKQRKRNERRFLKKQQLEQKEKERS